MFKILKENFKHEFDTLYQILMKTPTFNINSIQFIEVMFKVYFFQKNK